MLPRHRHRSAPNVHIPFSQRRRPGAPGPIYIGFEQPVSIQQRKPRFNWSGFLGLMLALLSPLTLFLIAPVALLASLWGLRRSPRGMAAVGTVLSLAATAALAFGVFFVAERHHHFHRGHSIVTISHPHSPRIVHGPSADEVKARGVLESAQREFEAFATAHRGYLPELSEGMFMAVQFTDPWEKELYYEPTPRGGRLRSAGPDGEFHTKDDLTCQLQGIPGHSPIESSSDEAAADANAESAEAETEDAADRASGETSAEQAEQE